MSIQQQQNRKKIQIKKQENFIFFVINERSLAFLRFEFISFISSRLILFFNFFSKYIKKMSMKARVT